MTVSGATKTIWDLFVAGTTVYTAGVAAVALGGTLCGVPALAGLLILREGYRRALGKGDNPNPDSFLNKINEAIDNPKPSNAQKEATKKRLFASQTGIDWDEDSKGKITCKGNFFSTKPIIMESLITLYRDEIKKACLELSETPPKNEEKNRNLLENYGINVGTFNSGTGGWNNSCQNVVNDVKNFAGSNQSLDEGIKKLIQDRLGENQMLLQDNDPKKKLTPAEEEFVKRGGFHNYIVRGAVLKAPLNATKAIGYGVAAYYGSGYAFGASLFAVDIATTLGTSAIGYLGATSVGTAFAGSAVGSTLTSFALGVGTALGGTALGATLMAWAPVALAGAVTYVVMKPLYKKFGRSLGMLTSSFVNPTVSEKRIKKIKAPISWLKDKMGMGS